MKIWDYDNEICLVVNSHHQSHASKQRDFRKGDGHSRYYRSSANSWAKVKYHFANPRFRKRLLSEANFWLDFEV